jgi:hypothetical protein
LTKRVLEVKTFNIYLQNKHNIFETNY